MVGCKSTPITCSPKTNPTSLQHNTFTKTYVCFVFSLIDLRQSMAICELDAIIVAIKTLVLVTICRVLMDTFLYAM